MNYLSDKVEKDVFYKSTIYNVYYDTDNFELIRKSIEKPIYKEKLRIRSYDKPTLDSSVYVELKKKYDHIVYKRREKIAYKYILKNINWRAEIVGMDRVETPEIPVEAIREIVVNSFAHMKVNNSSFNEIYITPTRIHIYNPGFLVKGKSPLDFANGENGPIARNPLINTVLYLNKTIESFGTGFGRVFKLCDKENVSYSYKNNEFGFVFEFLRKQNVSINVPINVSINLSKTEALVLDIIKNNKGINKTQIAKMIDRAEMTVQRAIKKLIDEKLIRRVGSNKNGYWEII